MGQMSSTPPSVPSPAAVVASQANFRQNNGSVTPILMPATAPPSLAAAAAIAAHYRRLEGDRRRSSASNDDSDEYLSAPDRRIRHRNRSRDRRSLTSDSEDGSDRPPFVNPLWSGRRNLLDLITSFQSGRAMLSDHSSDEGEDQPRSSDQAEERSENRPYITIPAASSTKAHASYRNLRQEITIRAGLMYDEPSVSMPVSDTVTEMHVPLPSCSTASGIMRNCRYGMGRRPQFGRNVGIDEASIVAIRNRATPNRRKIVDRTPTKTFCIEYLNGGRSLLTASQDNKLRIYDQTGTRRRYVKSKEITVPFIGWSILDFAVSPDGNYAVYSTWHNALFQCDLRADVPTWQDMPFESDETRFGVFSIKFNSAGTEVATGATSGLYVYDREIDRCVVKINAHDDDVNAVCYPDDSSFTILSSGDDGLIKLWDRRASHVQPASIFAGHRDGITYLDTKKDGKYFLSNSKDQSIKVWDLRVASDRIGIHATRKAVGGQRWDYRWQMTRNFKTTNLPGDSSIMTLRGHSVLHTLVRAKFSPPSTTGNRFIYTGCARGGCLVYDLYTGEMHKRYGCHRSVVRDAVWHPYDNELLTSSWDGNVYVWRYDNRGPTGADLNMESQVVQDYDSTDEFDEPVPRNRGRPLKRSLPPVRPVHHQLLNLGPRTDGNTNRVQMKIALEEEETSSEEESRDDTYAAIARRHRRQRS